MKKIFFLFLLVGLAFVQVDAQSCSKSKATAASSKSCAKKCTKATKAKVASAVMEADVIAAEDETIEKKECAVTGSVAYYKKSTCEKSGKVSMEEVQFDAESKEFVKVASVSLENEIAPADEKMTKKASCAKTVKADGKACCSKDGKCAKDCCKGKKVASETMKVEDKKVEKS